MQLYKSISLYFGQSYFTDFIQENQDTNNIKYAKY